MAAMNLCMCGQIRHVQEILHSKTRLALIDFSANGQEFKANLLKFETNDDGIIKDTRKSVWMSPTQ